MLNIKSIDYDYQGLPILCAVNLTLTAGTITHIKGESGCGKTSLIKIITGLIRPSKGKIFFKNCNITNLAPHLIARFGIGWAPQHNLIFNGLTVKEHLHISRKKICNDLENFLQAFPVLKEKYAQKAQTLSGGQKKLLAIARALSLNPDMLLLDDPMANLQISAKHTLQLFLNDYCKGREKTILVTDKNYMASVKNTAQHFRLHQGRVEKEKNYADPNHCHPA